MKIKWQWYVGGRVMFWTMIISIVLMVLCFIVACIIDPVSTVYMKKQSVNPTSIQLMSENYVRECGITIDRPITYSFARYHDKGYLADPGEVILLGTFHEWNDTYCINISVDLYKSPILERIVIHETRHMIVEYLKDKKIIDLSKYTEEIAQEQDTYYNNLFDAGVYLLRQSQLKEKDNG